MHGGKSPGAAKGNSYAFKHGRYTKEHFAERQKFRELMREINEVLERVVSG
jgi:hypothetical protein